MEYYQENGQWEYLSFETSITDENRDARYYSMSNVIFKFRRRPQFIVFIAHTEKYKLNTVSISIVVKPV
jgi:hypothetical protein